MTTKHPRNGFVGVVLSALLLLVGVACTGGDKPEATKPSRKTTTTTPKDCIISAPAAGTENPEGPGAGAATTTSILQRCLDQAYMTMVKDNGSAALQKVPKDQVLAFGHGLCTYAQTIAAEPANAPTFDELVKSTSKSWGVKPAVFEEVLGFASTLCPDQLKPVLDLKANAGGGAVELELSASSASPIDVTYLGPDGNEITNQVQTPWTQLIRLGNPTDYRFTAKVAEGDVACGVTVKGKEIKSAKGAKGKPADCSVTAAELRSANS